jgi:hypothetical protein
MPKSCRNLIMLFTAVLLIVLLTESVSADTLIQPSEWSKSFTDSSGRGNQIIQTNDNCCTIAGVSHRFFLLAKADLDGEILWWKTYQTGEATCVIQTNDNGYAVAGSGDVNFIKTDFSGNILWAKNFMNGSNTFKINSIAQTSDGGYILAGYTPAGNYPQWDLIIKTDSNGSTVWSRSYGTEKAQSFATDILVVEDGYVLAANSQLYGLDSEGSVKWEEPSIVANSLTRTSDGGYLLTASAGSTVVKTDQEGKEQWRKTYRLGSQNIYNYLNWATETIDGGVIACGTAYPNYAGVAWVIKTDADGNEVWNVTANHISLCDSQAASITQDADGSYVFTGAINRLGNSSLSEVWLAKVSSNIMNPTSVEVPASVIGGYSSPTPSIPEYPTTAILCVSLAVTFLALIKRKRLIYIAK